MLHRIGWLSGLVTLIFGTTAIAEDTPKSPAPDAGGMTADKAACVLDFTMKDISGKDTPLSTHRGEVLLIVNVASKCGFTKQYKDLQELYTQNKDKGLRILAFPANNFMGQEPGSDSDIKQFCDREYGVTFDLFSKISVKGKDQHELYKFLTSKDKNGEFGGDIEWNFTKFLVGRDGKVIKRFGPRVKPTDDAVVAAVNEALKAPKPARP